MVLYGVCTGTQAAQQPKMAVSGPARAVCMRQQTALLDAVEEDDEPEVRRLLEAGAIVDNHLASRKHETALHRAALFAHLSVAKLLLAHGADADARDKFGETPLHKVAQNIAADHMHRAGLLTQGGQGGRLAPWPHDRIRFRPISR